MPLRRPEDLRRGDRRVAHVRRVVDVDLAIWRDDVRVAKVRRSIRTKEIDEGPFIAAGAVGGCDPPQAASNSKGHAKAKRANKASIHDSASEHAWSRLKRFDGGLMVPRRLRSALRLDDRF
jgi:hypothetical protein